ncbi:MAG TPA: Gfo/Idh/MocA family oxidoreductase [Conexibacter sp.]|nr:Gfo/Idh/MocA family oxidoreductase [Conexibacter sp.]
MSATVRIGVIGCGEIGRHHLEAYGAMDGVEVVAIADIDAARLAEAGERFGVAHRHTDGMELLAHELDLVSVCTMPNTHRDFVVAAHERGAHVMCEKPIALSVAEAAEMVSAAERAGRLLFVGFNMRYMGATSAVRRFMDDGLLGELICARGFMVSETLPWWGKHYVQALSGGGILASTVVHMVDLVTWLAGLPKPLTATASMARVFPRKRAEGAPAGAVEAHDVEDVLFGHVRCEGGFWFSVDGDWVHDRPGYHHSFDLRGTHGQAQLDPLELYTEREGKPVRVREDESVEPDWLGSWALQLRDVVAAVRGEAIAERLATGRQALVVQAIVDALYRSAREGREVAVEIPTV